MAIVSCPECSKKLKVADTSVGKKVKCSCGNVFVAKSGNGAPAKAAAALPDEVMVAAEDEASAPKAKGKAVSDDDMDDLFTFAQKDAGNEADDDDDVRPKGKAKAGKRADPDDSFEEDDFPKPKSKFGAKSGGK